METMRSHHNLTGWLTLSRHTPLLVVIFASIFIIICQTFFEKYLQTWGFSMITKDISIDENLPNFFDSLKLHQANEVMIEYLNMKHNYGFEFEDPAIIKRLLKCTLPRSSMIGHPWYNILANPVYRDKFSYFGAYIGDRNVLIEDEAGEGKNKCG